MRMDINNFVHSGGVIGERIAGTACGPAALSLYKPREASLLFRGLDQNRCRPRDGSGIYVFIASHPPRTGPNRSTASTAPEHVGVSGTRPENAEKRPADRNV